MVILPNKIEVEWREKGKESMEDGAAQIAQ